MTNRVSIDATGIKVSKPGFDVLTATKSQLIFDSADGNGKVLAHGSATLTKGPGWHSKSFPKAFTTRPMVFYQWGSVTFIGGMRAGTSNQYMAVNTLSDHFDYICIGDTQPSTITYWILDWDL